MTISLFDVSVPTFLQTVRAIGVCLDRAVAYCSEAGIVGAVAFDELRSRISGTELALEAFQADEVNAWSGKKLDMQIHTHPQKIPFTSETYLLSFLLPNFYFHAVTAYDILRTQSVPIGKSDFEGQLRKNSQ